MQEELCRSSLERVALLEELCRRRYAGGAIQEEQCRKTGAKGACMRSGAKRAVQEELYIKEELEGTAGEREWQLDNANKIYCYLQLGSSV